VLQSRNKLIASHINNAKIISFQTLLCSLLSLTPGEGKVTIPFMSLGLGYTEIAIEEGWNMLDELKVPDFSDWNRFKVFAGLSKVGGIGRYRLGVCDNSIWERFRFLRGFNNALTDLINHPQETKRLLEILTDVHITIAEQYKKAGADGIMLVDDWGTQDNSFISPGHFEEFFLGPYSKVAKRCHELGRS